MAKYDDFGRPIYETAEEYNQAHRGGVCPRTYDSSYGDRREHKTVNGHQQNQSAAQRHATVQGSKNAKSIIVAILVGFVLLNLGVIVSIFHSLGMVEDSYVDYEEESWPDRVVIDSGESYGGTEAILPVGFDRFSYNGVIFNIPMTFDEVLDGTGIYTYYDEEYDSISSGSADLIILYDTGDVEVMQVLVKNNTDEDIPIGECIVEYISVVNPAAYDSYEETPDFWFGQGIGMESTSFDFETYLGKPYYHEYEYYDDGGSREYYEWRYVDGFEVNCVSVQFLDEVVEYITIEKGIDE